MAEGGARRVAPRLSSFGRRLSLALAFAVIGGFFWILDVVPHTLLFTAALVIALASLAGAVAMSALAIRAAASWPRRIAAALVGWVALLLSLNTVVRLGF